MWQALAEARGVGGRDEIWSHPDLLPTAEDLDDPKGFVRGRPELDLSAMTDEPGPAAEPGDSASQPNDPDAGTGPDPDHRPGPDDGPGPDHGPDPRAGPDPDAS